MQSQKLKPCEKFKGMTTNGDVCAWILASKRCGHPDLPLEPCPGKGQRLAPRPYERFDTEEDSFE
jgi:hypothetical protein